MIDRALAILRAGGVVGMPTETVYGLAADARDSAAIARVFALKGRPSTNPLIVHVASVEIAERYAVVDDRARRLFAASSPGPLTVVLPKRREGGIADAVTAGLDSVGIRIPSHPLALDLLRAFDGPIAAPSANKSNHVSPTTADHVRSEFGDAVPVLDGGPCAVGIESSVLSLVGDRPRLLRPGVISRAQIESILGPIDVFAGHVEAGVAAASPGQSIAHYAPRSPAFRIDRGSPMPEIDRAAAIVFGSTSEQNSRLIAARSLGDAEEAARSLYAAMRELDALSPSAILIELPPDEPKWAAIRDRVLRATRPLSDRGGN